MVKTTFVFTSRSGDACMLPLMIGRNAAYQPYARKDLVRLYWFDLPAVKTTSVKNCETPRNTVSTKPATLRAYSSIANR
jgi:hypothetical protein